MSREEFQQRLEVAQALINGVPCYARVKADGLPWLPLTLMDTVGCWNPAVIFFEPYEVRLGSPG